MPALGYLHNFGLIERDSSYMMIGYDEVEDVQFLGKRYKAYWAKDGKQLTDAFEVSIIIIMLICNVHNCGTRISMTML